VSDSSPLTYLRERTCELDIERTCELDIDRTCELDSGVFALQGLKYFASCAWPMLLRKLGDRWKWKGESWFHYTKVLFVGVVGITEMWFYLV